MAPDIHTPNKDDTTENDIQNVSNNSIANNANNTSEMERSKKLRKVSHYATTPYFVNSQQQQQQQQQQQRNRLFFNNHPKNDMRYKKVLLGNTSYNGITQSSKKAYIFGTSMLSNVKAKKLNNKLQGASIRIRDFRGATMNHVLPSLVHDTQI